MSKLDPSCVIHPNPSRKKEKPKPSHPTISIRQKKLKKKKIIILRIINPLWRCGGWIC